MTLSLYFREEHNVILVPVTLRKVSRCLYLSRIGKGKVVCLSLAVALVALAL